jgi:hypothetical protein
MEARRDDGRLIRQAAVTAAIERTSNPMERNTTLFRIG